MKQCKKHGPHNWRKLLSLAVTFYFMERTVEMNNYWINFKILVKIRSCIWQLELGFRTYDLVSLLRLVATKLVFISQISRKGLLQDLNLGSDMNVSSRWSITNVKRYCIQIGLLYSSFMFTLDIFKRWALFSGSTLEYRLLE